MWVGTEDDDVGCAPWIGVCASLVIAVNEVMGMLDDMGTLVNAVVVEGALASLKVCGLEPG